MSHRTQISVLDTIQKQWTALSAEDRASFRRWQEIHENKLLPPAALMVEDDKIFLHNFAPALLMSGSLLDGAPRCNGFRIPIFADEQHFARGFERVWRRIPKEVRQLLLAYWRPTGNVRPLYRCPEIRLVHDERQPRYLGYCDDAGFRLTFKASITTDPRHRMESTIAHELAHVYFLSTGEDQWSYRREVVDPMIKWSQRQKHNVSDAERSKKQEELYRRWYDRGEVEADELAASWGFARQV